MTGANSWLAHAMHRLLLPGSNFCLSHYSGCAPRRINNIIMFAVTHIDFLPT